MIWTARFWQAAAERAIRTFAQALAAAFATGATGLLDVDWPGALSAAGMAAVLSLLTSLASARVGGPGPSLGAETVTPARDNHGRFAATTHHEEN